MAAFGDQKTVVLGKGGVILVAAGFLHRGLEFLVVHVGDTLEKEQREDVRLEVGCIHRPAQDVGRLPEVAFQVPKVNRGGRIQTSSPRLNMDW